MRVVLLSAVGVVVALREQPQAQESPMEVQNEKRKKIADDIQAEAEKDSRQNFRISGLFEGFEKEDEQVLKEVKADRNLDAFLQVKEEPRPAVHKQASLETVEAEIAAQRAMNVDIHTPFAENEKVEKENWQRVRSNPNLQALIQTKKRGFKGEGDDAGDAISKYLHDFETSNDDSSTTKSDESSKSSDFAASVKDYGASDFHFVAKEEYAPSSQKFVPTTTMPHSHNYGGSVISIPLSSQLQVSFLQTKNAPGVEQEVAKERKWDVYLHDQFAADEKKDETEIKRVNSRSRPEMRPWAKTDSKKWLEAVGRRKSVEYERI